MHKALGIRDAVYNLVDGLVSNGTIKEAPNGAETPRQLPAVSVLIGDDNQQSKSSAFSNWQLTIYTDIFISTTSADVDAEMLAVRSALHKAIMADTTLGLDYVIEVDPVGQQDPERSNESDDYRSGTRLTWAVSYRTSVANPDL